MSNKGAKLSSLSSVNDCCNAYTGDYGRPSWCYWPVVPGQAPTGKAAIVAALEAAGHQASTDSQPASAA